MLTFILASVLFTQAIAAPTIKTTTTAGAKTLLTDKPGPNVDGTQKDREIDGEIPAEFLVLFGTSDKGLGYSAGGPVDEKVVIANHDTVNKTPDAKVVNDQTQKPSKRDAAENKAASVATSSTAGSTTKKAARFDFITEQDIADPTKKPAKFDIFKPPTTTVTTQ